MKSITLCHERARRCLARHVLESCAAKNGHAKSCSEQKSFPRRVQYCSFRVERCVLLDLMGGKDNLRGGLNVFSESLAFSSVDREEDRAQNASLEGHKTSFRKLHET